MKMTTNFQELSLSIVKKLCWYPDDAGVEVQENSHTLQVLVRVNKNDQSKLLGKDGSTMSALGQIVSAVARTQGLRFGKLRMVEIATGEKEWRQFKPDEDWSPADDEPYAQDLHALLSILCQGQNVRVESSESQEGETAFAALVPMAPTVGTQHAIEDLWYALGKVAGRTMKVRFGIL